MIGVQVLRGGKKLLISYSRMNKRAWRTVDSAYSSDLLLRERQGRMFTTKKVWRSMFLLGVDGGYCAVLLVSSIFQLQHLQHSA